ncbi:two-component system response regulator NarL [Erwiniaceae bacterium BAC15a-03b]|uniref:Two-component system response regulator NarL n=1 Tax=Winslowiella arboricola TaxID=2978220 RepID=A0A9J6PTM2_9GAMM|nr:two-component system response regulator NarL [Winslowiella arboricola]MCU5774810.1 two-component system response regulator NarL [Winslowiella arboricola]MCU5780038.1 two-component system response regulator NarL [Winslowiella arboricola]
MTKPTTVLLIDDHPLLRHGVRQLIATDPRLEVIAEAGDGVQGIALAEQYRPDLILLDLYMPALHGLDTLIQLRERSFIGRILIFSASDKQEDVVSAFRHGADGYLLKNMAGDDLLKNLHQAVAGQVVLSGSLTNVLVGSLRSARGAPETSMQQLTRRERDILKLIAQGLTNKAIARKLVITESTVKVHVKHLLKKMKLKSRVEAAVWAHHNGNE